MDVQSAKLKEWYVFSQPWSLWPLVVDRCGVILAWWRVLAMVDLMPLIIGSALSCWLRFVKRRWGSEVCSKIVLTLDKLYNMSERQTTKMDRRRTVGIIYTVICALFG